MTDDWAVFKRTDGRSFDTWIPVCPDGDLPAVSSALKLVVYFSPLGFIEDDSEFREASIWPEDVGLVQYETDRAYIVVSKGICAGASGAPVVTPDGTVIAFHTESFNEQRFKATGEKECDGETASVLPKKKMSRLSVAALSACAAAAHPSLEEEEKGDVERMEDKEILERLSSTRSYSNYIRGTVMCKLPRLMALI